MLGGACNPCCGQTCVYDLPGSIDISYRGTVYMLPAVTFPGAFEPADSYRGYRLGDTSPVSVMISNSRPFAPFFGSPGVYVASSGGLGITLEEFFEFCNAQTNQLTHWVSSRMANVGESLTNICPDAPLFNTVPVQHILTATGIEKSWIWPEPYNDGDTTEHFQQFDPGVNMFPVRIRRSFSHGANPPAGRSCNFYDYASEDMTFTGFPGVFKAPVVLP